jgi:hypothetical protein
MAFGVMCLSRSFLNLRRKLKLWIRMWARQGGRAEGCAALGARLLKLDLFSLAYGERRAFLLAFGSSVWRQATLRKSSV